MPARSQKRVPNKSERWFDVLAILLLLSLLTTASARLVATGWVQHLSVVHPITFFAILAGLALGYSTLSGLWAWLFGLVYGTVVIPWQIGLVLTESIEWKERLWIMAGRLSLVLGELSARKPVTDNIFFLYLMGILFWTLSVYAGYHLTRTGNAWLVIIPGGLATFLIHTFDINAGQRAWYLAVYIFLGLLMQARITFINWRREWAIRRSHVPPDVAFDISRSMVILTTIIVLFAWNLPVLSGSLPVAEDMYKTLSQPFFSARDRFSYMFAALRSTVGLVSDYYGDQQGLGQGQPKSNEIVMTVEGPIDPFLGSRFYWRGRVYDEFSEGRWYNNLTERREYNPDQADLVISDSPRRLEGEFAFQPMQAIVSLYAPPQPVWFSKPGQIQFGRNVGEQIPAGEIDLVGMRAQPYIRAGEGYEVRSRLSSVTEMDLRNAGLEYPEWVTDRYLQIPDGITERTRTLAEQLTRGLDTPYDKALSITRWLRTNIQYSELIDAPPSDRDVLDWFLFDYKIGFCNYYATAEVILLRLAGVPARWAVGYAQGERQIIPAAPGKEGEEVFGVPERALYLVREIDAHSWPEVYFPQIGWVEFEPTVSQEPISRPSGETSNSESPPPPSNSREPEPEPEELDPSLAPGNTTGVDPTPLEGAFDWGSLVGPGLALMAALVIMGLVLFVRQKQTTLFVFWVKITGGDEQVVAQWQSENMPLLEQFERTLALLIFGRQAVQMDLDHRDPDTQLFGLQIPGLLRRWAAFALLPTISRAFHEVNRLLERLGKSPEVHATPRERVGQLINFIPEAKQPANELLKEYQTALYSQNKANPQKARQALEKLRRVSIKAWWRRLSEKLLSSLQD